MTTSVEELKENKYLHNATIATAKVPVSFEHRTYRKLLTPWVVA